MLHISTFGSRIFQAEMSKDTFKSLWHDAVQRQDGLLELKTTEGVVMLPTTAISSVADLGDPQVR